MLNDTPARAVRVLKWELHPTLCDRMDYTVHGILQARILERAAIPFSSASSLPRDWTQVSCISRQILYQLSHKGSPQGYHKRSKSGWWPNSWQSLYLPQKKKKKKNKLTLTPNFKALSLSLYQALCHLLKWPHTLFVECAALSINSLLTHHSCSLQILSWWSKKLKFTGNKSNDKERKFYVYIDR